MDSVSDSIIEKIQKLKTLAERGEKEEAKGANRFFEVFVKKYNLDPGIFEGKKRKEIIFLY